VFSVGSVPRGYFEDNRRYIPPVEGWQLSRALHGRLSTDGAVVKLSQLRVQLWSVKQPTAESPLLRVVTRKRLVKTRRKNSHCGELLPSKD
jgi:hypothetical protein